MSFATVARTVRRAAALCCCAVALVRSEGAVAVTAQWTTANIDNLVYANAEEPGRELAPSFIGGLELNASQQFLPHSNSSPE